MQTKERQYCAKPAGAKRVLSLKKLPPNDNDPLFEAAWLDERWWNRALSLAGTECHRACNSSKSHHVDRLMRRGECDDACVLDSGIEGTLPVPDSSQRLSARITGSGVVVTQPSAQHLGLALATDPSYRV